MDPDELARIVHNLKDKFSGMFSPGVPGIFAPGLRRNDADKRLHSKHGRPYTKPHLRSKTVKAKTKTRRKMARASRRTNRTA